MSSPIVCRYRREWANLNPDRLDWFSYGPFSSCLEDLVAMEKIIEDVADTTSAACDLYHADDGVYVLWPNEQAANDAAMAMIHASETEHEFVTRDELLIKLEQLIERQWAQLDLNDRMDMLEGVEADISLAGEQCAPTPVRRLIVETIREKIAFDGLHAVHETCPG